MRITAIAAAAIVTAGVVAAPHTTDITAHCPAPAIQTHTLAVDLTAVALQTKAEDTTSDSTAAATTQPSVFQKLQSAALVIGYTAAVVALVPVWYAAFPVTIPVSIALGVLADAAIHLLGGSLQQPEALAVIALGLAGWAVGPLYVAGETVKLLGTSLKSLIAPPSQPAAAATAAASSAPRIVHQNRPAKSGLAGSRRTAAANGNTNRPPSSHRTTKATHTSEKKRTTMADSGRSTSENP